ncbi:MAG: hypothetical protein AABX37_02390 [Nanoarchaeota archaeon]
MKKGQMEVVGLVIIVILITLGLLFLAQFALKDKPEKKIFTRKGLAYSTISAVMRTTVPAGTCMGEDGQPLFNPLSLGKDILEDCTLEKIGNSPRYTCDGKTSCPYFNDTVNQLLQGTLGTWNKRYDFSAVMLLGGAEPQSLFDPITNKNGCENAREIDAAEQPIPLTGGGLVQAKLRLCD